MGFPAQFPAIPRVRLKRRVCIATLACAIFSVPVPPASAIVGGTATTTDEWPWQGALTIDGSFSCGATLIEPRVVLTAAHCVHSRAPDQLYIRFGRTDHTTPERREVAATVADLYVSPNWGGTAIDHHDFALLLLEQRVNTIKPIDLATASDDGPSPFTVGDPAWIMGWGRTQGGLHPSFTSVLMEAQVGLADCSPWGSDNRFLFCVEGTPNVCTGDSGGPLVVAAGPRKFRQIGVASFADFDCNIISGFTNVVRGPVRTELNAALAELKATAPPPRPGGPPPGPPHPIGAGPPPLPGR
jgi:secreted trypsin-like serine protease